MFASIVSTLNLLATAPTAIAKPAAPQKLAFIASPGNAAGSAFDPQPTVAVEDSAGNIVTTDRSTVSLAITRGAGAPRAKLLCIGDLTARASNGVAQFPGCAIDLAGTYTLTARDGTLSPALSSNFIVSDPTIYRFSPSPIAPSGSLAAGAGVAVTLTVHNGNDVGIPNAAAYLSFNGASGGGSAAVGTTPLTATPALFQSDGNGALLIMYTAPTALPAGGQDSILVQDPTQSAAATNSDSYAFSAVTPVVSVGNVDVVEGDQDPGAPASFTVTVAPPQASAVTVQYSTLCGVGDTFCQEDFREVSAPITVTIAANTNSTTVPVTQHSYVGTGTGEVYNEGWFVRLVNPSGAVLGRSIGTGMLLPDVENGQVVVPTLSVGDAGLVPTADPGLTPVYFTVTLGGLQTVPVSFSYATSDGTALAGIDYVATSGTATIPAGQTTLILTVGLLPRAPPSMATMFNVALSAPSGGFTIARAVGNGILLAG